jgi:hypothetical protein
MIRPGRPKTVKGATRTTIYILAKDVVKEHILDIKKIDFKKYINDLIKQDILSNARPELVKEYFNISGEKEEKDEMDR